MEKEKLLAILSIGHDTSMRGDGLSLRDVLDRIGYADMHSEIRIDDIVGVLRNAPELAEQWIMYSEDKRTDGGWYINSNRLEIGRVSDTSSVKTFGTIEEAVANYIVLELDFRANVMEYR